MLASLFNYYHKQEQQEVVEVEISSGSNDDEEPLVQLQGLHIQGDHRTPVQLGAIGRPLPVVRERIAELLKCEQDACTFRIMSDCMVWYHCDDRTNVYCSIIVGYDAATDRFTNQRTDEATETCLAQLPQKSLPSSSNSNTADKPISAFFEPTVEPAAPLMPPTIQDQRPKRTIRKKARVNL